MCTKDFLDIMTNMTESSNPIVVSTGERTLTKEGKLRGTVLSVLQSNTHFLDSPAIRESLSKSDLRFEDLKKKKITVYLVLTPHRSAAFAR